MYNFKSFAAVTGLLLATASSALACPMSGNPTPRPPQAISNFCPMGGAPTPRPPKAAASICPMGGAPTPRPPQAI